MNGENVREGNTAGVIAGYRVIWQRRALPGSFLNCRRIVRHSGIKAIDHEAAIHGQALTGYES
jgi:hypothetical protein